MGVYDCIVATIECPNCGEQVRWLEQLKLGFYRMNTYYIGQKIDGSDGDYRWEYNHTCKKCSENFNFIYFIDRGWFNSVIVYDQNWKRFKKYTRDNKLPDLYSVKVLDKLHCVNVSISIEEGLKVTINTHEVSNNKDGWPTSGNHSFNPRFIEQYNGGMGIDRVSYHITTYKDPKEAKKKCIQLCKKAIKERFQCIAKLVEFL